MAVSLAARSKFLAWIAVALAAFLAPSASASPADRAPVAATNRTAIHTRFDESEERSRSTARGLEAVALLIAAALAIRWRRHAPHPRVGQRCAAGAYRVRDIVNERGDARLSEM